MNLGGLFKGRSTKAKPARAELIDSQAVKPPMRESRSRPDPAGARFNSTASDHFNTRGSRFDALRAKLRFAFTPSQPVADRRQLAGRQAVLKTIIQAIEDQRLHVILYGERGIGKTSLLHVLSQTAVDARYIVIYTSCGANSTFDDTFRAVAADIPLLFHSGFSPTGAEAEKGSTLADLLPDEPLSPRKFGDLCAKLTGTRVLIILDEFDRALSGSFRRDIAEVIKNLSDRLGRVQLVLAGVAADLTELVEHIPSIRRNIFALRIPKMSEAEVTEIVANGERESNLNFDAGATAFVVEVARGSPYIANLICHHAGHAALDQNRSTVLPGDVGSAIDRAIAEFQGRIATPAQQHVRRLFDTGRQDALAMSARAALAADGVFSASDIEAGSSVSTRKAQEAIEALSAERLVKPVNTDEAEPRYVFVEEGLPTLIWMMWAQRNLNRDTVAPRAAAAL
jgi:Cdc6-like AAA superfamily ATPase